MMKSTAMLRNILAKFLVLAMVLTLVGVASPNTTVQAAAKPVISKTTGSVLVGKKLDLDVKNQVKGATYTWKSSNTKIATVDKKGVVTGKKKGTATIAVTVKTSKVTYKLTSKVTVRTPATSVAVSNKVTALNAGQSYTLKTTIKPATSNDVITWKSSDAKVIKVDAKGKLTAVKAGSATVTGKTLSGKSVKLAVKVTDKAGTVTTQKELNRLLGSGAAQITLKSEAEATFAVNVGTYTGQAIAVNAPKADIVNNGTFKSIEIKAIKASTWTENATGNAIIVTAPEARIIVAEKASADIVVNNATTTLKLENNGTVKSLKLEKAASVEVSGTSKTQIPVEANASGVKLTSSIPLNLTASEKITLKLLPGAESTKVTATTESAVPAVEGNIKIVVTVGTGADATTKEVSGEGYTGGTTPGTSGGGSIPTTPSLVTETITGVAAEGGYVYKLPVAYTSLEKVTVVYDKNYDVTKGMLTELGRLLNSSADKIKFWNGIEAYNYTIDESKGITARFEKTASADTKKITFNGGDLNGKSYEIKVTPVSESDAKVTVTGAKGTYEFTKNGNNELSITTSTSLQLSFNVSYYK
jgi:hypothetical protein